MTAGEPALVEPLGPAERRALSREAERLARYVQADALRPKPRYRQLLLLHASAPGEVQSAVERVLVEYAGRWRLVDTFPGRAGSSVLEYLVRFKRKAELGELLDRLQAQRGVRAIEITALAGRP